MGAHPEFHETLDATFLEQDLALVAIFALKDEIRASVSRSVDYARKGVIQIIMITGDDIEVAKNTAVEAGFFMTAE